MARKNKIYLGQSVFIKPLKLEGVIISIWKTFVGTKYEVRYFKDKDVKEVYFFKNELEYYNNQDKKTIGFASE